MSKINNYDFIALLFFFTSIFILYMSYRKFADLIKGTENVPLENISQDIQLQITTAFNEIKKLDNMEVNFMQYVWSIIKTFSCSIVKQQQTKITNIITQYLSDTTTDFLQIAETTCFPKSEIFTENYYTTGNIDPMYYVNKAIQYASYSVSPAATNSCIVNVAFHLKMKKIAELQYEMNILFNRLNSQGSQIQYLISVGASMSASTAGYLLYRIENLLTPNQKLHRPKKNKRTKDTFHTNISNGK